MRHVFYNKVEKLTEEDQWYLQRYLNFSKELKAAYQLKERFNQWLKS
ncbi:transposase [Bacillus sp. AL-1R]